MKTRFILLLLCCQSLIVWSQNFLKVNEQSYKLVNGLKIISVEKKDALINEWMLSINAGPVYETAEYNACASINACLLQMLIRQLLPDDALLSTEIYNDYVNFYVKSSNEKAVYNALLQALSAKYQEQHFNQLDFSQLKYFTSPYIDSSKGNIKAIESLYGINNIRMGAVPQIPPIDSTLIARVNYFKKTFYCPLNATLFVTTANAGMPLYKSIEDGLVQWKDCTTMPVKVFPTLPIVISPFNSYKKNIVASSDSTVIFEIFKPAAATYKERTSVLYNLLLSSLINHPETYLHRYLIDSLKAKSHHSYFNPVKFASISKWVVETNKPDLLTPQLKLLTDSLYQPEFLNEKDLTLAKEQTKQYFNRVLNNKQYMDEISHYFNITNIDFYGKFIDSIQSVSLKELTKYIKNEFCKSSYSVVMNADTAVFANDTLFIETAYQVNDYQFNFLKNVAIFADSTADSTMLSLYQWLKINEHVRVKINGVSCKDELLGVRDDSVIAFLKQNPTFEIAPESVVPTKKIRLDVYRSMIIVKKLIEMGVNIAQLSGTGKSENVKDELERNCQRVYCTVKIQ